MKMLLYKYKRNGLLLCICMAIVLFANAQNRSQLLPQLAPFYHGVASGDPTTSAVIIWTRVTTQNPTAVVNWKVATDVNLLNIVKSGTAYTDAGKDFTVKVDVTGLQPNTTYYYEFETENKFSLTGRTKTIPTGTVNNVRLAIVSCSNYAEGYYNAYKAIKDRNDVDAVIHLGDYIYEYGNGEYGNLFNLQPPTEILTLADYRLRYNYNKLDTNLLRLHQQYAFITIWDDHESADNAYKNGANNHTEGTEGAWVDRKAFSIKAYREWMPIRDEINTLSDVIYRGFKFGNLADISFLDTRITGRDLQLAQNTVGAMQDQSRNLMGPTQLSWFKNRIDNTTSQWKIIAQQVMVAPLRASAVPINMDQWDGYEGERNRVYDIIRPKNNVVVLTGDIHTSWANDLPESNPLTPYVPGNAATPCMNSLGAEFVITSVTSPGLAVLQNAGTGPAAIMSGNPHMKYIELASHGFGILDITPQRAQHEWYFLSTITSPIFTSSFAKAFAVNNNEKCVNEVLTPSIPTADKITTQAPNNPRAATILAVQLLTFKAVLQQQNVLLNWQSELNNCTKYLIQKSIDGIHFKTIDTQQCSNVLQYNYTDVAVNNGTNYYRIAIEKDNLTTYSNVLTITKNISNTVSTSWYPNPTVKNALCNIVALKNSIATIKIIDGLGNVIIEKRATVTTGVNEISINCTALSKGLYVYEVLVDGTSNKMHGAFIKL